MPHTPRTPEQARAAWKRYYAKHHDRVLAKQTKRRRGSPEAIAKRIEDERRYRANVYLTRKHLSVIIDRAEDAQLTAAARKQGISKAELVRSYITWGLENDTGLEHKNATDTQADNPRLHARGNGSIS